MEATTKSEGKFDITVNGVTNSYVWSHSGTIEPLSKQISLHADVGINGKHATLDVKNISPLQLQTHPKVKRFIKQLHAQSMKSVKKTFVKKNKTLKR